MDTTQGVSDGGTSVRDMSNKLEGMLGDLGFEDFQDEPEEKVEEEVEAEEIEATEDDDEIEEDASAEEEDSEQSEEASDAEQAEMPQTLAELAEAFEVDEEIIRSIKVPIKVDGEASMTTLGELVKGYQLEQHSQRKLQALAEEKRTFEQERMSYAQVVQQQMAQSGELLKVLEQKLVKEIDGTDWQKLRDEDPAEFAARRSEYQERVNELEGFKQHITAKMQQENAERARQQQEQLTIMAQGQQAELVAKWADWGDPDKRDVERDKLRTSLINDYGFTEQEVNMTMDHRSILLARDAARYREMMRKGDPAKKRVLKAPKTLKKGATANTKSDKLTAKRNRLKRSGDVRDMASYLYDMLDEDT